MDADEARAQLELTERKVVASRFARSTTGLYLIGLGLAFSSLSLLRHHPWGLFVSYAVMVAFIVVNLKVRVRPRPAVRPLLAALAVCMVSAVIDSIWFYDKGWDSAAYRWLSTCITGLPLVALGVFQLLRERSE